MKDICIPVPDFHENDQVEIQLIKGDRKESHHFRVVSFPWEIGEDEMHRIDAVGYSLARIERLRNRITRYDKKWELIQIFTPSEDVKHIQVLYRKRKNKI